MDFFEKKNKNAFTLIELLIVISIIGLLGSIVFIALSRSKQKARDAKRLVEILQVQKALEGYYAQNGRYPNGDTNDCSGWDTGNLDFPLLSGRMPGFLDARVGDPIGTGCSGYGYRYYRYSAGTSGCDVSKGAFYVLGINRFESTSGIYPGSPGFSCPSRDWQGEFRWVTGAFENP